YAGFPVIGLLCPGWRPAVPVAQLYALGFGLAGLVSASLVPGAVALAGARVVVGEQIAPMAVSWLGFLLLAVLRRPEIGWVILPMHAALVIALWLLTDRSIRPRWQPEL